MTVSFYDTTKGANKVIANAQMDALPRIGDHVSFNAHAGQNFRVHSVEYQIANNGVTYIIYVDGGHPSPHELSSEQG